MIGRNALLSFVLALSIACIGLPPVAAAQAPAGEAANARTLLQDAMRAMGSPDSLGSLGILDIHLRGTAVELGQSAAPDAPPDTIQATLRHVVDLAGHRGMQELHTAFRGHLPLDIREVVTDSTAFTVELSTRTLYPAVARARADSWETARELFPQFVIAQALGIPDSALGTGARETGAGSQDGFRVRIPGQEIWLWFDHQTHRLASLENMRVDPQGRTSVATTRYEDYRPFGAFWLPRRIVREFNGRMTTAVRVTLLTRVRHAPSSWFAPPSDAYKGPEVGGMMDVSLDSIAPGVYVARNGLALKGNFFINPLFLYTSLVVCSDTSVTVVETPIGNGVSRAVIAAIHSRFPGSRIRYACPTHYHGDHLGGVGAFADSGAIVITTPGNRGEVAGRIAHGMGGQDSVRALERIETFTRQLELREGRERIVLLEVPNPHVSEMVVAWLPGPKILFVSDLFEIVGAHAPGRLPPSNPCLAALRKAIVADGLDPRLIVSGHGRVAPGSELGRRVSSPPPR